jgi:SNF2 family DNA or RNA helicase
MIKLFAHQKVSVAFVDKNHRVFDMSDAGTGKTGVHVTAFAKRRRIKGGCALILAPKSLLSNAWGQDFKKFAPDMKISIAHATNRKQALAANADVYITNHDAVKVLTTLPENFWKKFDTIIIDESTAFKHGTSARSKSAAKIVKRFARRACLSATPSSNGVTNIWHQMFLLDDGKRLGKSFFAFRAAVCSPVQVGMSPNMVRWEDKGNSEAIVSAIIKDITIRHRFKDCVDIPPNHEYPVNFELNTKHRKIYKELETNSMLLFKNNRVVSAVNAAVLYNKLLQVSSGAVYSSDRDYEIIDRDRYELVIDLAEARPHVVVFFRWAHQKECLIAEAKKRDLTYTLIDGSVTSDKQREDAVKHFQAGFYRILFAHPQSAGHGLTLTKGTATIWASPTPDLEHYLQGLKRIHRIGQTQKTETIMVLAPDTIEERVYESLLAKDAKMASLLDYLKKAA